MSKVVVLGNATMDFVLRTPRWPSSGETVLADAMTQSPGGKGLNQAVAAARLGAEVHFVAPIGRDLNGQHIVAALEKEHSIRPYWLMRDLPTDISTVWTSATGENMIVSSAECARSVSPHELDLISTLEEGDLLLLQGNLSSDISTAAARWARARNAKVFLNTAPIWWDMSEIISLSHVVICNEPEMHWLTGGRDLPALDQIRQLGPDGIVVTRGAEGAVLAESGTLQHFSAPKVRTIDTSGAGDMAVGAIVASVLRGRSVSEALRYAMKLAALTVTRPGTLASFPTSGEFGSLEHTKVISNDRNVLS